MKDVALPLCLMLLALAGNYFSLPIFPGIDFLFGGIFVLLLLQIYGWRWALLASLLAGAYTLTLWNHPFGLILLILEIVFIAFWQTKKHEDSLLTPSAFYWFFLAPLAALFFYLLLLKLELDEALVIYLKMALNGIFNATIVSLLLALGRRNQENSVANLITLLVTIVVMLPCVVLIFARVLVSFETAYLSRTDVIGDFITNVGTLLFFLGLAILGARVLSIKLANPLKVLGEVTTDLAANPSKLSSVNWPETNVTEIGQVTENVKQLVATCNEYIGGLEQARREYEYLAMHDPLTNLPNRTWFERNLESEIKQTNGSVWLYIIDPDLDRINDSFGHGAGDAILLEVGDRIRGALGNRVALARYGNGFVFYATNLPDQEGALELAEQILAVLRSPFAVVNQQINLSTSIGLCNFPRDGKNVGNLVKNADLARHEAKAEGKNKVRTFDKEMALRAARRLYLENRLPDALAAGEIFLHYQPQIHACSGQVYGVEALVRWQHPDLGMIPPLEFIGYAEESGFIDELGHWILEQACLQAVEWEKAGFDQFVVSVNVSQGQLNNFTFVDMVAQTLEDVGLDPKRLQLEITESLIMDNPLAAGEVCRRLREMGVKLAMDDFGTGYSSLEYLRLLPWNTLKLDRTFVQNIANPVDEVIIKSIIGLAQELGLQVIAEGVEDNAQLAGLEAKGCRLIQGYLFAKPMPPEDLTRYLREVSAV